MDFSYIHKSAKIDESLLLEYGFSKIEKSSETVAIHHYKGSWLSEEDKRRSKYHLMKKNLIIKLIGKNNLEKAKSLRNKLLNKI